MSLLWSRLMFLPILLGVVYAAPTLDGGKKQHPEEIILSFPKEKASLSEMFREVEELMEDTEYKLRNAVEEIEAEEDGSKQISDFDQFPPNYHNDSYIDAKTGNKTLHIHQEINKATDNKTGSVSYSETVITSIQEGESKRNHECIIDEDCETGKYCEFSGFEYKCYVCKPQHTHCSRDDECCGNQLCVWGECLKAASRGANGTICESQRDCNSGMCCALTKGLLFPVCTPLPGEGESCHDPSNRLLNLITWEPDGALDRCPCAHGLTCKMQSYSSNSLCELSFNKTENKDTEEPFLVDEISLLDLITQDIPGDYEETLINQMQEGLPKEVPKELDIASDRLFADKM
ncbi:dickkopf-related protein 3 [Paroedura picta]|uniref:dickkopf-related protein 3 n=1 Tax=Paroedura picta TaxID=143630 RepID=UPI004055B788